MTTTEPLRALKIFNRVLLMPIAVTSAAWYGAGEKAARSMARFVSNTTSSEPISLMHGTSAELSLQTCGERETARVRARVMRREWDTKDSVRAGRAITI